MSFIRKLPVIGKMIPKPQSKSYGVSLGSLTGSSLHEFAFNPSGRITPYKAMQIYRETSSVAIAIDKIASAIEQINPVVVERSTGKVIDNHDVLKLLNNPNQHDDAAQFMNDLVHHYLLTHNALVFAVGSVNRPPLDLYAAKPQHMTLMDTHIEGYPSRIILTAGEGQGDYAGQRVPRKGYRYYDGGLKEIYRIRGFSSRSNNSWSDSPLEAVALETRQLVMGKYHNLAMLENGGRLSLVAIFKDTLDQEQQDDRRQRLNERFAGPMNANRIAVVSAADLDIKEFGKTNKDMDFATLDSIARELIFMRYNIPLPLVSNEASTFNNMDSAVYHFYDYAVLPTYTKIMNGLSSMLLPRYGQSPEDYYISYNMEEIRALKKRTLEELKLRREIGVETANEIRAGLSNRPPVEGGNLIYQPANLVPIGTDVIEGDEGFTEEELNQAVSDPE